MPLRRFRLVLSLAALFLGACAAVFGPRHINVSHDRLQQLVDSRFPVSRRYLDLFDVTVASPRLTLRPEANRIGTTLDFSARDRLTRTPLHGAIELDFALRFDPADNTIRLSDVRVEHLVLQDVPAPLLTRFSHIGRVLAEEMLSGQVVHTLTAQDVQSAQGRGYRPGELKVTAAGVSLTLDPAK